MATRKEKRMRELLVQLLDRLGEVYVRGSWYSALEDVDVRRLRHQIRVVLDRGVFDATLTDVDMRQLPLALGVGGG